MRPTRPRSKTQIAFQQLSNYSSGRASLVEAARRRRVEGTSQPLKADEEIEIVVVPSEAEIEFKEKVLGDLGK